MNAGRPTITNDTAALDALARDDFLVGERVLFEPEYWLERPTVKRRQAEEVLGEIIRKGDLAVYNEILTANNR